MAERLVAADASPLIGLAAAGAFHLLRQLFGEITVTTTVRDEVLAGGTLPGALELAKAMDEGWIKPADVPASEVSFADLGAGESSTLNLAINHSGPCLVLMDELGGRWHAKSHGLACAGVAGVLLAAKQNRFVTSVRPFFDQLEKSNFRLSTGVVHAVLETAGEL